MSVRKLVAAGFIAAGISLGFVANASAAPITCPGPQDPAKPSPGEWECLNNGGNFSGAAETKNPND